MDLYSSSMKRCEKCGSYVPSEWRQCGRCGYPVRNKRPHGKGLRAFLLLLTLCIVLIYKDDLVLWLDRENSSESTAPGLAESERTFEVKEPELSVISDTETVGASGALKPASSPPEAHKTKSPTYVKIYDALLSSSDSVRISPPLDSREVFDMIEEIVMDEPEILFYEGCSYRADGLLKLKYNKPKHFMEQAAIEVDKKAEAIIKAVIKPEMTDFEKEQAIHDYIVQSCRYDTENLKNDTLPPESHSAYGVLIEGKAVCEGYAKAMKLLFDRISMESFVVIGHSKDQTHAWNIVKINGSYYHIDATWDDPVMAGGDQVLQYTYFNLSDNEISKDHEWERVDYPSCTNTRHNYFEYLKKNVDSQDAFYQFVLNSLQNGERHIVVRIDNYSDGSYKVEDLISKIVSKVGADVSYSLNESYGVVELWFSH